MRGIEKKLPAGKYVFTWAQVGAPLAKRFFRNLRCFCRKEKATLIVIPGWAGKLPPTGPLFSKELEPFLPEKKTIFLVGNHLRVYANMNISPTKAKPASGHAAIETEASALYGHPKLQLESKATATRWARISFTTGAVTLPNYLDNDAGYKAEERHVLGAAIIELDSKGYFFPRQLLADKCGNFIDLNWSYKNGARCPAPPAQALELGDAHVAFEDKQVTAATFFGPRSLVSLTRPKYLFHNDVLHFVSRGHHDIAKASERAKRFWGFVEDDVSAEVKQTLDYLERVTPEFATSIVKWSNHHDHFDQWLERPNCDDDPRNYILFHELKAAKRRFLQQNHGEEISAFELCYSLWSRCTANIQFLAPNEVFKVGDRYFHLHGHIGPDGSRGTKGSLAKLASKTASGHTHSASIFENNITVGVGGKREQGYNKIPSSWTQAHYIQYANGLGSLIFFVNGKFRA